MDFGGQDYDCAKVDMLINHLQRLGFSVQVDDSRAWCSLQNMHVVQLLPLPLPVLVRQIGERLMCLSTQSALVRPNIISNAAVSWSNLGLRAGDECPPLSRYSSCRPVSLLHACPHSQSWQERLEWCSLYCAAFRQAVEGLMEEESRPMELVQVSSFITGP